MVFHHTKTLWNKKAKLSSLDRCCYSYSDHDVAGNEFADDSANQSNAIVDGEVVERHILGISLIYCKCAMAVVIITLWSVCDAHYRNNPGIWSKS